MGKLISQDLPYSFFMVYVMNKNWFQVVPMARYLLSGGMLALPK
jgi:hypothetical protein